MPSGGGVFGRPKVFKATVGAGGLDLLSLESPISGRTTHARSIRVANVGAAALDLYLNEEESLTVAAGATLEEEMLIHKLAIGSTAGTDYEVLAVLAA